MINYLRILVILVLGIIVNITLAIVFVIKWLLILVCPNIEYLELKGLIHHYNGWWWYWDPTKTSRVGPFSTKQQARDDYGENE